MLIRILPLILLLSSCGGAKLEKMLKSGTVENKDFKITIPFEYRNGLMIIQATIKDKEYDFILDTGASNVLTTELYKELGLEAIDSETVYGIHGVGKELEYTAVDNIDIGGVEFLNTIAAVHDLNAVKALGCMGIDGIIGSNLMMKAIWDIDFTKKEITITNSEASLEIPENNHKVKFFEGYQGTPSIILEVNGLRVLNIRIDTGFNGDFSLSTIEFQKLLKKDKLSRYVKGRGSNSVGVYGAGKPTTFYQGMIEEMSFGDLQLKDAKVAFKPANVKLIGMGFLKNCRVIFNWNTRSIKFIEKEPYQSIKLTTYGFGFKIKENKLHIMSIMEGSSAHQKGLKLGDQILSVDDKDYEIISPDQWCGALNGLVDKEKETINIKIKRDDTVSNVTLNKRVILQ